MKHFDPDAAAPSSSGIFGLSVSAEEAEVVLLPVAWDATTSYRAGTALGPQAVLEASRQVDLFDIETGRPYAGGIALLPSPPEIERWNADARRLAEPIIQAGGVLAGDAALEAALRQVNALSAEVNGWVYAQTRFWLGRGKLVGTLGGDHSAPFGAIRAHAERYPGLGILHVDAHADLRAAYEGFQHSHASIMHNVMEQISEVSRLVQVGVRDLGEAEHRYSQASDGRVITHFDALLSEARLNGVSWATQVQELLAPLPERVYVSFDIDGLDPTLCPNTGTPVPGGLSFAMANSLLRALAESGRHIVGFDLCEVAPDAHGGDWDANVGARLLYKLVGWARRSRPGLGPT